MMEEVVEYSQMESINRFDELASLDIMMAFIEQLMKAGRNELALGLLKKVVEIRTQK